MNRALHWIFSRFLFCFLGTSIFIGCATYPSVVKKLAAYDLECWEKSIKIENLTGGYGGNYMARGCGKQALYICQDDQVACMRTGEVKNDK